MKCRAIMKYDAGQTKEEVVMANYFVLFSG